MNKLFTPLLRTVIIFQSCGNVAEKKILKFYYISIILLISLLIPSQVFSQSESDSIIIQSYQNVVVKSDSLFKIGKIADFNKKEVIGLSKKMDKQYPLEYLNQSFKYLKEGKYNESAFLYFLAKMRVKDFEANGNGMFKRGKDSYDNFVYEGGASKYDNEINEIVVIYLSKDINNYKNILKEATDYYDKNSHAYFKGNNNYKKVKDPMKYKQLISEFEKDPKKVSEELKLFWKDMANKINGYFPN